MADRTESRVVPLTVELVVSIADGGTRGGWLPYMQLLFALEVATGRPREVCVSAIMGAALSGYLDVEQVDQMLAIGRVRTTAAGRSLVPESPARAKPKAGRATRNVPGCEGSIGPFGGQFRQPHVYARDVHSGAGNCVCGADLGHDRHVQAAPGVDVPDSMRHPRSAP